MVEIELIQQYGEAVARIATASDGGLAIGTTGLTLSYERDGSVIWTKPMRSDDDKIRPTQRVRSLAFSEDGKKLFVAASDQVVALEAATGKELWRYSPPRSFGFLVVSPTALDVNGDFVAASFDNGSVVAWNLDGQQIEIWKTNDAPRMLRMLSNGMLCGTDSFSICVWDVATRTSIQRHRLDERAVGFDASPSGTIVCRSLRSITVQDMADLSVVAKHPAPSGPPWVAINHRGDRIAFAGEYSVTVGPTENPSEVIPLDGRVSALTYSEYKNGFLAGLSDGRIVTIA
jgi:WD40 repeat protein